MNIRILSARIIEYEGKQLVEIWINIHGMILNSVLSYVNIYQLVDSICALVDRHLEQSDPELVDALNDGIQETLLRRSIEQEM